MVSGWWLCITDTHNGHEPRMRKQVRSASIQRQRFFSENDEAYNLLSHVMYVSCVIVYRDNFNFDYIKFLIYFRHIL